MTCLQLLVWRITTYGYRAGPLTKDLRKDRHRRRHAVFSLCGCLDLMHWGITHVTSTDLWSLWGASCRGANLTKYLDTIAAAFPKAFSWSFVRPGRGSRPHLFEIRMSQTLMDQLIGDEASTSSAVTMASLALAV